MAFPSETGNHFGNREMPVRELVDYVRTLVQEAFDRNFESTSKRCPIPTGSDEPKTGVERSEDKGDSL
jgi:hypothetical protein